jgi:hypothetical protein
VSDNHPQYSAYALCTVDDVVKLVPGYRTDDTTDQTLIDLINSESELLAEQANRELVAIAGQNPRTFDIDCYVHEERDLYIGDATTINTITIRDWNGTVVDTPVSYVPLPRIRKPWEPITSLWFRPDINSPTWLVDGFTIDVDAVWGFPLIPSFIVRACAARVLLRYISDVASKGTSLAEAIDDVNAAALFASSKDALTRIRIPSVA